MTTWLTPYWDVWREHVGAIAAGRLAKALAPARDLLGDERCVAAFTRYCTTKDGKAKHPEWFARECKRWDEMTDEPVVNAQGMLTQAGLDVYRGIRR